MQFCSVEHRKMFSIHLGGSAWEMILSVPNINQSVWQDQDFVCQYLIFPDAELFQH